MIYVGIDISKYKHDCFIATETTNHSFSFENSKDGFNDLLFEFKNHQKDKMIIGLEATGHYSENLKAFLLSHGYKFMEINPLLIKRYATSKSLRETKTDKKDAKMISSYMMTVDFKAYHHQSYHISALKSLTRLRSKLISIRTKNYNMLTKTLDIVFPEFKQVMNEVGFSNTSLYILKNFSSPKKISKMTDKHFDVLRKLSKGKLKYPKFGEIKSLAASTVGATTDYILYQIKMLISYIEKANSDIDDIERQIASIMRSYPTQIESIKGIGIISAAIIAAEFGDVSLYKSSAAMLSYAGLEPRIRQSGTQESVGRLVKRGSRHLRSTIINVCSTLTLYNPIFCKYYNKKKQEGKHHRVAQVHLARKLIRIIYHLETTKTKFNPELLR